MSMNWLVNKFEYSLFRHRLVVLMLFAVATLVLLWRATDIKLDAAFSKNIPLKHEYMQTYLRHQRDFGGANSILIAVEDSSGNIYAIDGQEVWLIHNYLRGRPNLMRVYLLIDARHGLHYAHWKQHLALYPIYRGDEAFEAAVGPYRAKTDSVHFSHAQPLPLGVIEVIATALAARD